MILNVRNETGKLKAVVLGQPESIGEVPLLKETYDAKSYETIQKGIYPAEESIIEEMTAFEKVFLKYGVQVFRPKTLQNCNQVFARDVAFVIDDKIVVSNIIPDRVDEQEAYRDIFKDIDFTKIYNVPDNAHVEGGDVVLHNDTVFVGVYSGRDYSKLKTARTNLYAFYFLKELFPHKTFYPLELVKHNTNPHQGVLHLDCTFMPIGNGKALIYKGGFQNKQDYHFLLEFFGEENIFRITQEEMYYMNTNVFSISPNVVVTEQNFTRLNHFLENEWGMTVEKIPYAEISKMGGLLRCSTLPLIREN